MRQAVLALLFDATDLHRDVPGRRVELEVVEHRPAEHVGQEDVERDRGRADTARASDSAVLPAVGDDALEALVARQPEQDARVVRIVLDDEQRLGRPRTMSSRSSAMMLLDWRPASTGSVAARIARDGRSAGAVTARGRAGVVERQVEGERAALPGDADEPDLAAEQRRQLAADRQTQAGAAVLAAGAGVGLLERLEDEPLLLRRDADAGVVDREGDDLRGRAAAPDDRRPALGRQPTRIVDVALAVNLNGVRQQVLEDLLQPLRVAGRTTRGSVGVESTWNGRFLASATWRKLRSTLSRSDGERDLLGLDGDRARLDLRQVEDVVDQRAAGRSRTSGCSGRTRPAWP